MMDFRFRAISFTPFVTFFVESNCRRRLEQTQKFILTCNIRIFCCCLLRKICYSSSNYIIITVTCGIRPSVYTARIVNGSEAPVNGWPWQAMLLSSSGSQFCGGSLIHPQWVLTATHCVRSRALSDVKVR